MERTNSGGKKTKQSRSTGSRRKSMRNAYLDDDEFSVAPSMDQDVKSVVSVSFDDVYKRGRKVRSSHFVIVSSLSEDLLDRNKGSVERWSRHFEMRIWRVHL